MLARKKKADHDSMDENGRHITDPDKAMEHIASKTVPGQLGQ